MIALSILIAWLLADFITGVVHWFEDRYMESFTLDFLDSIARENDKHHQKPTAMLVNSGWTNIKSAAYIGWPIAAAVFWLGFPFWGLTVFFATLGNLIHRFAHQPRKQLPRWIRGMQEFGLFISPDHHDQHHRSMKKLIPKHVAGFKFCAMTDWLNPILDFVKFWTFLESFFRLLGLKTTAERKGLSDDGR